MKRVVLRRNLHPPTVVPSLCFRMLSVGTLFIAEGMQGEYIKTGPDHAVKVGKAVTISKFSEDHPVKRVEP